MASNNSREPHDAPARIGCHDSPHSGKNHHINNAKDAPKCRKLRNAPKNSARLTHQFRAQTGLQGLQTRQQLCIGQFNSIWLAFHTELNMTAILRMIDAG